MKNENEAATKVSLRVAHLLAKEGKPFTDGELIKSCLIVAFISLYYKLINKILQAMNNKFKVGGILYDLEKAFDCINHTILLDKLQLYCTKGKFLELIQSYLRDRFQKVIIENKNSYNRTSSKWEKVVAGVPQGSILGPLLFLLYINDLPKIADKDTNIVLFADDTSIIVANPNHEQLQTTINKTFSDVVAWFKANLLSLNFNKTFYIEFKTKKCQDPAVNINYGNKITKNVTSAKFLGLTIDNLLKWDNHITN
jgi:hypothetical protein